MKVLVACEFSGIVREAFRARGHDAWSCDLLPAEDGSPNHFQGDISDLLTKQSTPLFDLLIAHPPCTHLSVSGARWFKDKLPEQEQALIFAGWFITSGGGFLNIPRIAVENPIGILSTRVRKPDQIIQPWMFGHPETKATCLWLKNLPHLVPTNNVQAEMAALPARERGRVHHASPGPDRWKERSRTLPGIAAAMADQWGGALEAAMAAE